MLKKLVVMPPLLITIAVCLVEKEPIGVAICIAVFLGVLLVPIPNEEEEPDCIIKVYYK